MTDTRATELVVHSLVWHNPYTSPPEGMPRVLAEEILPRAAPSVVVDRLWFPGCGYSCCWRPYDYGTARRLSESTKQSMRRKLLTRRVQAAAPLFAAELIASKLEANPDYYGVKGDSK